MQWCWSCKKKVDLKVSSDGFADCPACGRIEIPDHMRCARCGFVCPHVEAGGVYGCPNCGDPKPVGNRKVKYEFNQGCEICGLPGHMPKPGYMEPAPCGHPCVVFGLAPGFYEEDVAAVMDE